MKLLLPGSTVGNEIKSGQFAPAGLRITILNQFPIPYDGFICSFSAWFQELSPVRFQIWREITTNHHETYTLMKEYDYTPQATGPAEVCI